jgi:hypothetical protein
LKESVNYPGFDGGATDELLAAQRSILGAGLSQWTKVDMSCEKRKLMLEVKGCAL